MRNVRRTRGIGLRVGGVAVVVAAILAAPLLPVSRTAGSTAVAAPQPMITFSATIRATGHDAIYTANVDGSNIRKITPDDGRNYNWGRFAFGNTKIVYSVRYGPQDAPEDIEMMNVDGSGRQLLKHLNYRVAQPLIDPAGRYLYYTGKAPFFPLVGLFRMDLETGISVNITARGTPAGGFDADPLIAPAGDKLLFIQNNPGERGAYVKQMNLDGGRREALTTFRYYNTDPAVTVDGKYLTVASWRGKGLPSVAFPDRQSRGSIPEYWYLTIQPRSGGKEKVLTGGRNCVVRSIDDPCTPKEMSAFQPRFTADQKSIAYIGALDNQRTCICLIDRDGSNARIMVARTDLAFNWQEWPQPAGYETSTARIGSRQDNSRLLVTLVAPDQSRSLAVTTADMAVREPIPLPRRLQPVQARWAPDRRTIVFTAKVAIGKASPPHPAAPRGETRREHVTLDDINPVAAHLSADAARRRGSDAAELQVFLRTPDGRIRQLTDPWIEDWRDGVRRGDARSNSDPVVSPDGRFVTVTNTSTLTGESFLLRIDLSSGAVLNLTNGTAGALPTDDAEAAYAPGGRQVAFAWTEGSIRGIYTMEPTSGRSVKALVEDSADVRAPAYAPDGSFLAYTRMAKGGSTIGSIGLGSERAGTPSAGRGTRATGSTRGWAPVVGPRSDRIGFLNRYQKSINVWTTDTRATGSPRPLQPDTVWRTDSVDWR